MRINEKLKNNIKKIKGFSLIELLVTTSIITALIGLTLPALSKAREKVYRTMCASNLRNIGISIEAYETEYEKPIFETNIKATPYMDHEFPVTRLLNYVKNDYVKNTNISPKNFLCPGDKDNQIKEITNDIIDKDNSIRASYDLKNMFLDHSPLRNRNEEFREIIWDRVKEGYFGYPYIPPEKGSRNHNQKYTNFLMKDGSVKGFTPEELCRY